MVGNFFANFLSLSDLDPMQLPYISLIIFFFFNHSHFLNLKLFLIYFIQCLRSKVVFYNSEFQSLRAIA